MKRMNRITRIFAILTLVALLVMMLPVSVMAKGNGKPEKPAQATEREPKADKAAKVLKVKSNPQAAFVAARNEWARENTMPPGYANIMYKYLVMKGVAIPVSKDMATVEPAMNALNDFFTGLTFEKFPEYFNDAGDQLDIKVLMSTIKQEKLLAEETETELPEVEELEDEEEEEEELEEEEEEEEE